MRFVYSIVVSAFFCVNGVAAAPGQIYDKVVAAIAGEPILLSEVRQKVKQGPLVVVSGFPSSASDTFYDRALHDAINIQLIYEACRREGIDVSDEDIDQQMRTIASQQNASVDDLRDYLRSQNISFEKYRSDLKQQILVQKFYGRILRPVTQFSEQRLKEYYQAQFGSAAENIRYSLGAVRIELGDNPQETLSEVRDLWKVWEKSNSLKDTFLRGVEQEESSQLNSVKSYVALGDLHQSELTSEFRQALQGANKGEIVSPVLTASGIYVLHVLDRQVTDKPHYQSQKSNLRQQLLIQSREQALHDWLLVERSRQRLSIVP